MLLFNRNASYSYYQSMQQSTWDKSITDTGTSAATSIETETETGTKTEADSALATEENKSHTGSVSVGTGNEDLDEIIEIAGYSYDARQDIFISNMKPWQRYIGYCRLFDEAAAPLGMIIDCEPITFDYLNEKWMIGLWKGQYDLVSGGEIGLYKSNGLVYQSVNDKELLDISYTIKKDGKKLFSRKAKHWWLTGFKLGEFAEPNELTMDICLTLKDVNMRNAFLAGMRKVGYNEHELAVQDNSVSFTFDIPKTAQPWTRTRLTDQLIQRKNKFLCEKYQEVTGSEGTVQERLKLLEKQDPEMYKKVKKIGKRTPSLEAWMEVLMTSLIIILFLRANIVRLQRLSIES